MNNPWFRMYHEFSTDPKVQMMSEADQRRLVMLFCIRCSNGDVTLHETFKDEQIAFQLRISDEEWLKTKDVFIEKGFVDEDLNVLHWDSRQFISDSSAERVRRHREKNKKEANKTTKRPCNVTVTPPDTDTDTEKDISTTSGTSEISQKDAKISRDDVRLKIPYEKIVDLYHEILPELQRVEKLTKERKGFIRQRWITDEMSDLANWRHFFTHVRQSKFLMGKTEGKNGSPPFVATLEWMIRPRNFINIAEKKYHRDV